VGLDIIHYKGALKRTGIYALFHIGHDMYTDTGGITRESFSNINVPFDHFKKYVQEIDCPIELESAIILQDKKDAKRIKEHFKSSGRKFFIKESEHQLHQELTEFEKSSGYLEVQKCFENIKHQGWTILKYYRNIRKEGFYFKAIGDQRKGMNSKFWEQFCSNEIYNFALKKDFDFALSCVDYYWDSDTPKIVEERKEEFNKYFINNFEEGASFMMVSY